MNLNPRLGSPHVVLQEVIVPAATTSLKLSLTVDYSNPHSGNQLIVEVLIGSAPFPVMIFDKDSDRGEYVANFVPHFAGQPLTLRIRAVTVKQDIFDIIRWRIDNVSLSARP